MKKLSIIIFSLLMLLTVCLSSCDSTVTVYDINGEEITISKSIYDEFVIGYKNRFEHDREYENSSLTYLGEYQGGYYFSSVHNAVLAVGVTENIVDIQFEYGDPNGIIYYLFDEVLYALNEAYEHLLLSKAEIERLYDYVYLKWTVERSGIISSRTDFLSFGTYLEDKVEFNKDVAEDKIVSGYIVLKIDNNFVNNDLESYFKNNSYAYSVNSTDITLSFSHQLNYETIVMKLNEELDLDELEILANQLLEEDLFKEVEVLTKDYSVEELDDTQTVFDFTNVDNDLYSSPFYLFIDIKPSMINYNYQAYFSGMTFEIDGEEYKVYYYGFVDADTFVITISDSFYSGYSTDAEQYLRDKLIADELYKLDFVKQVYPLPKGQSLPTIY